MRYAWDPNTNREIFNVGRTMMITTEEELRNVSEVMS